MLGKWKKKPNMANADIACDVFATYLNENIFLRIGNYLI